MLNISDGIKDMGGFSSGMLTGRFGDHSMDTSDPNAMDIVLSYYGGQTINKLVSRAWQTSKERIENLEAALGQLQDGIAEMKIGFADKFQHLEGIVTKLSDTVLSGKGDDNHKQVGRHPDNAKWLRKAYQEEGKEVMWEIFYEELWSRFGPTDCEDFDEALSKALVGTFMGGLKHEIGDGMFKPTNLKDATSLARMRDEQLNRLSPITQASSGGPTKNTTK
ncbi:hypothetical protein Tco_0398338 [Tanacetum coccineum]